MFFTKLFKHNLSEQKNLRKKHQSVKAFLENNFETFFH